MNILLCKRATWFILSLLAFLISFLLNGLFSMDNSYGVFHHNMKNISNMYPSAIKPPGFIFGVWGVIYAFQTAMMAYSLSTLCRKNSEGLVFQHPCVLPSCFHICYILSWVAGVSYCFLFDREHLLYSTISLFVAGAFTVLAIYINSMAIYKRRKEMLGLGMKGDLIANRVLVQNGLDIITSWYIFSFILMLSSTLQFSTIVGQYLPAEKTALISLSILFIQPILRAIFENAIYFEIAKYTYAGYAINIWCLIGVIIQLYDQPLSVNGYIAFFTLGLNVCGLIAKVVTYFYYRPKIQRYSQL